MTIGIQPHHHVCSLGLSARAENALWCMRINSVDELSRLDPEYIDKYPLSNFGRKSRNEVKEAIFQLTHMGARP